MRRRIVVLLVLGLAIGSLAPAAHAGHGTATSVALGLASFAVFNQLFAPVLYSRPAFAYAPPVYVTASPPIYVLPPQATILPPPAPSTPTVVQYPHGRYELRGDGVRTAYHWVWIPNPPPAPPAQYQQPSPPSPTAPPTSTPAEPCKPTGRYVKTPQGVLPECE